MLATFSEGTLRASAEHSQVSHFSLLLQRKTGEWRFLGHAWHTLDTMAKCSQKSMTPAFLSSFRAGRKSVERGHCLVCTVVSCTEHSKTVETCTVHFCFSTNEQNMGKGHQSQPTMVELCLSFIYINFLLY